MDWLFKKDNYIASFRTVGVLIHNKKLLVQRVVGSDVYALPGGHVLVGESSIESLKREFLEEAGVYIEIERLIWIEECFWKWDKSNANTVSMYYLIHLTDDQIIPENGFIGHIDNPNVELGWVSLDKLESLDIYPRFLKDKINNILDYPEHFIDNQL